MESSGLRTENDILQHAEDFLASFALHQAAATPPPTPSSTTGTLFVVQENPFIQTVKESIGREQAQKTNLRLTARLKHQAPFYNESGEEDLLALQVHSLDDYLAPFFGFQNGGGDATRVEHSGLVELAGQKPWIKQPPEWVQTYIRHLIPDQEHNGSEKQYRPWTFAMYNRFLRETSLPCLICQRRELISNRSLCCWRKVTCLNMERVVQLGLRHAFRANDPNSVMWSKLYDTGDVGYQFHTQESAERACLSLFDAVPLAVVPQSVQYNTAEPFYWIIESYTTFINTPTVPLPLPLQWLTRFGKVLSIWDLYERYVHPLLVLEEPGWGQRRPVTVHTRVDQVHDLADAFVPFIVLPRFVALETTGA
jgi:hypothetical protein